MMNPRLLMLIELITLLMMLNAAVAVTTSTAPVAVASAATGATPKRLRTGAEWHLFLRSQLLPQVRLQRRSVQNVADVRVCPFRHGPFSTISLVRFASIRRRRLLNSATVIVMLPSL
eukprot:TRINITY_DN69868_c0_g1_i1.p1 TRINITY_DN69868_c0_g1~~TRINITY_DN69868_c0_g1_i1.p1  ORF type:complete len:117 (-),score=10.47 TRINITY_DN69868_c0_g1_i1:36-386(-)